MEGWTWKALCNEAPFRFGKNLASSGIRTRDPRYPKSGALTARPRGRFDTTEAPFQTETWPSLSQLTFMTVYNVKSFIRALTCTSSDSTEFEKVNEHLFTSLRRYIWCFLSKIECCNVLTERNGMFLPLFTIATLSNYLWTSFMGYLGSPNVANSQASC